MSVVYPTTQCVDYNLIPIPRRTTTAARTFLKVGCRRCSVCDEEKAEAKQKKWRNRIREMIVHYQSEGHRVVFATFTVHDDDYPTYEEMKERLSGMFNAMRMAVMREYDKTGLVKYWVVLEEGEKTGRIHAHVFFFVDKKVAWQPLWSYLTAYWTERYKAYIFDCKLVDSAAMAANYATKYAVKQIGYNRDRMLSSQFGWEAFMKGVKKAWLGIDEEKHGEKAWDIIRVPDLSAADALRVLDGNVEDAVKWLDEQFKVVGRIEVDRPVLHPFGGCVERLVEYEKGAVLCVENAVGIETSIIHPLLVYRPVGYGLLPLRQSGLAKLSLVYERVRDL